MRLSKFIIDLMVFVYLGIFQLIILYKIPLLVVTTKHLNLLFVYFNLISVCSLVTFLLMVSSKFKNKFVLKYRISMINNFYHIEYKTLCTLFFPKWYKLKSVESIERMHFFPNPIDDISVNYEKIIHLTRVHEIIEKHKIRLNNNRKNYFKIPEKKKIEYTYYKK